MLSMKKFIVVIVILSVIAVVAYVKLSAGKSADPRGPAYAGSLTCARCHSEVYHSHLHTAHYLASSAASSKTVHGSFSAGSNTFEFDHARKIVMQKKDSGMFQTYFVNGKVKESHRFDIVFGGVKGESYLYWKGDGLNQLPISYYAKQDEWLISPRYAPEVVDFTRVITSRCLECHASYIGDQPDAPQGLDGVELFNKSSLVYSVDCERCHGPGAQHVDFQTHNPQIKTARFISTYASLPRARKIEVCAVCHSGNKSEMLRSTFFFKPGDTLAKFKIAGFYSQVNDTSHLDVHGNQVQLLQSSKCFIYSKMDCATCHDVHQNQRGNVAFYTQKCLSCHSTANHNYCKMATVSNSTVIKSNCIQCHMPAFASQAIVAPNMNKTYSATIAVHTHHIAIYPQEAKKILLMFSK
jgi:hypothetical protein